MDRKLMEKDIEDAISEALTPEGDDPRFLERLMDYAYRKAAKMDDIRAEAYDRKPKDDYYIQSKPKGKRVRGFKGGGCVMQGRGGSFKGVK